MLLFYNVLVFEKEVYSLHMHVIRKSFSKFMVILYVYSKSAISCALSSLVLKIKHSLISEWFKQLLCEESMVEGFTFVVLMVVGKHTPSCLPYFSPSKCCERVFGQRINGRRQKGKTLYCKWKANHHIILELHDWITRCHFLLVKLAMEVQFGLQLETLLLELGPAPPLHAKMPT